MPFSSASVGGLVIVAAGIVDVNGYPKGITGSLTAGTGAALQVMKMAKRVGGQAAAPVRVTAVGDNNRNRHEYIYPAAQLGEISFLFGVLDMDSYAGFAGLKKYTDGNGNAVLMQSNQAANAAQAVVIATMDAQVADAGSFGLKKYINEIFPLVTVTPLLAQVQEVAAAEWGYTGIPSMADKFPWGVSLNATTHGATRAAGLIIGSDYPMVIETLVATTSQTTYALTYTPATPTTTYFLAWKNGTLLTTSGATVSGKTVTMTTPAYNDVYVFRYEATDYVSSN